MRLPTARFLFPLMLAVPVASAEATAPPPTLATPLPASVPAPPAQLATPAPVVSPDATPPAQSIGVTGVPPSPDQTR